MESEPKFGEYTETLESGGTVAAGEDDVFSTRFLEEKFRPIVPRIVQGDIAMRVLVRYRASGVLKDGREGISWWVWDFRNKKFIRGFDLPNFKKKAD